MDGAPPPQLEQLENSPGGALGFYVRAETRLLAQDEKRWRFLGSAGVFVAEQRRGGVGVGCGGGRPDFCQFRVEMSRYQAQQMHNEAFISLHTLPPLSALGPRLNLPPVSAHPSNAHT